MGFSFGGRGVGGGGVGGGGGGLHFRNPPDVFADAAARTAAFGSGGTLDGQHTQFAADRSLAIIIGTLATPTAFQTYAGGPGAYDDTMWVNRTDAVQGTPGAIGPQGVWYARIFMNTDTAPTAAPTGGSVAMDGTVTPPAGWVLASGLAALTAGQETYESIAPVDPENDTFPLTPTWGFPFATGGGLTQAQVDARIAPYARETPTGTIADAQIPDLDAAKVASGTLDDARIPAGVTRDSEAATIADTQIAAGVKAYARTGGGTIPDSDIPASIARDTEIGAEIVTQVKVFARAGERGVQVGDMDSESAADNQVPTADGSGGVAWEAQQNAPPTPVGDHNRYAAVLAGDHAPGDFTEAHFLAGTSSQTDRITPPTATDDSTLAFATPMALTGIAEEGSFEGNIRDTFLPAIGADNVTVEINGTAHVVTASEDPYSAVLLGTAEFILTEATS